MAAQTPRIDQLTKVIAEVRKVKFCGPSDESDEQIAVTSAYNYWLAQLKRLAAPLLPPLDAARLEGIKVDVGDIYSAYDARTEIDALLPDLEAVLEHADESMFSVANSRWIVDSRLIGELENARTTTFDSRFLVQTCREINSCFSRGDFIATTLLMRTVLNHV